MTSGDWQESDQLLTAVMTAFGSPTRPVPVGGAGRFDGTMLGAFRRPRVEGRFSGERMRAWDVEWGAATADLVIENAYVDITGAHVTRGASTMDIDGRFSLGFPRKDRGEELNARVRMRGRPVDDLKHAFELDDYQVDGALTGEFRVYGPYRGPFGFGRMQIDAGSSYGEAFDTASAALRFEGTGVRLDTLEVRKSTGSVTGAAFVGWDGTYSFNADARRVPVESLAVAKFPTLPLTGLLDFSASGSGTFDDPRYSVRGRVVDLFAARGGPRPALRAHRGARRRAEHRPARRRLAAAGGVGRRAHHAVADPRRRPDAALLADVDRSLRPAARAAPVAVHHGRRERRLPRRRAAARQQQAERAGRRSTTSTCACSTTT